MVKRGKKNSKDTPKKKSAKLTLPFDDDQGELNVSSDIAGSLPQSPQNIQTVSSGISSVPSGSPAHTSDTISESATILAYLRKIDASNEALSKRVHDLEASRPQFNPNSTVSATSRGAHTNLAPNSTEPSSVTLLTHNQPMATVSGNQATANHHHLIAPNLGIQLNPDARDINQPSTMRQTHSQHAATASNNQPAATGGSQLTLQQFSNDGILPDLQVLRHNPHISQSVSQILSAYDAQARQDSLQGKPAHVKKSGRFNTTDTVIAAPEARWPNEGYLGVNGKKRIAYDELSLPEWAVGQLYNWMGMGLQINRMANYLHSSPVPYRTVKYILKL